MKQGTTEKVKFKKLKRRLQLPEWQCIGLLESLWRLTATSTPEGDIGRLSNEDIAATIEYDEDADELIGHLVDCGWLDECPESRLIVHDWSEHAPNFIKGYIKRHGKSFADKVAKQPQPTGSGVAKQHVSGINQVAKQGCKRGNQAATKPSQVKSSQVKSSPSTHTASTHVDVPCDFDRFWSVVHQKVGKDAARREFDRAVKRKSKQMLSRGDAVEHIIGSMSEFARSPAARPRDHTPIHPATWLSQGRYDDDRRAWDQQYDEKVNVEAVF